MRIHFTKWLLAAFTIVALVGGGVAYAQEQVGSIEGIVVDKDGAPLPGATVEATDVRGTVITAVTDARGEFRYPSLRPGTWTLKASLQGYAAAEVAKVDLALGKTLRVNFTLNPGTFEETITVTADTVIIDVTKSAAAVSMSSEVMDMLPKGRDFTSLAGLAPGAADESFLGGLSIDGASGAENRFIIDGIDTTSSYDGTSAQPIITDFIDEVQVKSAGYAAEYGGSLGGVINAITKTGSNDFSGYVGAYYTDRAWGGDERISVWESGDVLYRQFEEDTEKRFEPGFALGGPIFKDKLWFFAAYQPAMTSFERTPDGSSTTFTRDDDVQYYTGNLKGNVGQSFMWKLAANFSPYTQDGVLPARDNSTPAEADLSVVLEQPRESYSLYADWVASQSFLVSGRVGYFMFDFNDSGFDATEQIYFRTGSPPVPQSDPLYRPAGWRSVPTDSWYANNFDKWEREAVGLDASWFFDAAGSHQLKFGGQYEKITNAVSYGEVGNQFEIRWGYADRYGTGTKGTYGSVAVRNYRTEGGAESTNYSLFLQDSWAVLKNLTLNIGVRAEQERVPNYGYEKDPTLPKWAMAWDFQDKLAPRLGFAWDVFSDQKFKVYGSYGTYFDITKLSMPRGSFGADKWITNVYPLNTTDWTTLSNGCSLVTNVMGQNPCPLLGTPTQRDLRKPTDPADSIDPNLKPMENREYQLGAEYLLGPNLAVGARYVNKSLINTIEDIGYLVCESPTSCEEVYVTGNPGKGVVAGDPDGAGPIPVQAEAIRDYQALELSFTRRFADNWMLHATYTYSELTGNYSGLASSDEFGRNDPNIERYFDGLVYGYDSQGGLVDGALNTDRPHAVEVQATYRFNFGLTAGVNTSWRSGTPQTTLAQYNGVEFYPNGRNDLGRTADLTQTDLYLAQLIKFGGSLGLEISLNVTNLFDEDTVTRNYTYGWRDDVCDIAAGCDYSNGWYFGDLVPYNIDEVMGANTEPYYQNPYAWQAPRSVRLGVKFIF
jgi:hypothetical protein